jgi:octaprenyl-diphosphate synthase
MIDRRLRTETDLYALIEDFFETTFGTDNALITEAIKRMLAAGGKRLRPRLTLLSAQAAGGVPEHHLHLAAYMELIHVATLVHDDVVDHAQTRRGVNSTAVDYGNRVSVLAGDYLFAWIFKNVTAQYPAPIPNILSATLADICDGEVLQLRALGNLELPLSAYVEIVMKKTASLFAASAECGAIMGGASPRTVKALRDFTGDERSLGKPVGNDLAERKVTIPVILGLAHAGPAARRLVEQFYREDGHQSAAVIAALREAGGADATREQIAQYAQRAKLSLAPLDQSAAKNELAHLADALIDRGEP